MRRPSSLEVAKARFAALKKKRTIPLRKIHAITQRSTRTSTPRVPHFRHTATARLFPARAEPPKSVSATPAPSHYCRDTGPAAAALYRSLAHSHAYPQPASQSKTSSAPRLDIQRPHRNGHNLARFGRRAVAHDPAPAPTRWSSNPSGTTPPNAPIRAPGALLHTPYIHSGVRASLVPVPRPPARLEPGLAPRVPGLARDGAAVHGASPHCDLLGPCP